MSKRGNMEFLSDIKEAIRRTEVYIEKTEYAEFCKTQKHRML
jgi:uncharacterized protein with HEPN domain